MHQNNHGFLDTWANRLVTYNRTRSLCLDGVHFRYAFPGHGDRDLSHASQFNPIINYMKLA